MVAVLDKISFDDSGGFMAEYVSESCGFWHFHPEYEIVLNTKSNGTRIVGDSVELFDYYDMVMIAGNVPHCWNYYRSDSSAGQPPGIMLHFKLSSLGDSFLSQHEMREIKELLAGSEAGGCLPTPPLQPDQGLVRGVHHRLLSGRQSLAAADLRRQ